MCIRDRYLDGGFDAAHDFIHRFILSDLENKILFYDSKTVLQEILQAEGDGEFSYELKGEEGPDHNKSFWVDAVRNGEVIGSGHGRTKKAAAQQAAYEAILDVYKRQIKWCGCDLLYSGNRRKQPGYP